MFLRGNAACMGCVYAPAFSNLQSHHTWRLRAGFGAEIVAAVSKRCFLRLESPPLRVCGYDTPFPLVFEPVYLPSVQKVVEAIRESCRF